MFDLCLDVVWPILERYVGTILEDIAELIGSSSGKGETPEIDDFSTRFVVFVIVTRYILHETSRK